MKLENKVAIVTGASDGLGKQVAIKLAKEKVSLALVARDKKRLEAVAKETKKLGSPKVSFYLCDIRKNQQIKETIKKIVFDFKNINILVNCAGVWQKLDVCQNIKEDVVDEVIQTNLIGLINFTRSTLPYLQKQKEAFIINISSRSGIKAQEKQSVYTASKWGVTGFSEVLKIELKETNVRIAVVHQGGVNTGMFKKKGDIFNQDRLIKPNELADVIVFILSRPPQIWLHDVRVEY